MLPHWLNLLNNQLVKDELHVFIRPQSIVIKRFKGIRGFKMTRVDQQKISLKNDITSADIDISGKHLSEYLQKILNDERWQTATAKVVLSNYFVRYVVIPWNAEIKTNQERQAYINHQFSSVYGDALHHWNKCQSVADYGQRTLASAVPTEFLQTIHNAFLSANIRLSAVQPHLMHIANQAYQVIKESRLLQSCWLVAIADGRLCLGLIANSEWCFVKQVLAETDVVAQIETLIQRERLLNNTAAKLMRQGEKLPLLLHWVDPPTADAIHIKDYRIIRLTSSTLFDAAYAESQTARLVMA